MRTVSSFLPHPCREYCFVKYMVQMSKLQQIIAHDVVLGHRLSLPAGLPWMFSISLERQWTYFLKFLTVSHKYVSSSEPQAFQNIQRCLVKSRNEASAAAWCGCLELAATNSLLHYQVLKSHSFPVFSPSLLLLPNDLRDAYRKLEACLHLNTRPRLMFWLG